MLFQIFNVVVEHKLIENWAKVVDDFSEGDSFFDGPNYFFQPAREQSDSVKGFPQSCEYFQIEAQTVYADFLLIYFKGKIILNQFEDYIEGRIKPCE